MSLALAMTRSEAAMIRSAAVLDHITIREVYVSDNGSLETSTDSQVRTNSQIREISESSMPNALSRF